MVDGSHKVCGMGFPHTARTARGGAGSESLLDEGYRACERMKHRYVRPGCNEGLRIRAIRNADGATSMAAGV